MYGKNSCCFLATVLENGGIFKLVCKSVPVWLIGVLCHFTETLLLPGIYGKISILAMVLKSWGISG